MYASKIQASLTALEGPFVTEESWQPIASGLIQHRQPQHGKYLYSTVDSLLSGHYHSASDIFGYLTEEVRRRQFTVVHIVIHFLFKKKQLSHKVQEAEITILSYFIATYVLHAAAQDRPDGFRCDIWHVVTVLGQRMFIVFTQCLRSLPGYLHPLILGQFLRSTSMDWASKLLEIMASEFARESGSTTTMSVARIILSINGSSATLGPIWFSTMQILALNLSYDPLVCLPCHGLKWRRLAGLQV